jgi:hypothetical protein
MQGPNKVYGKVTNVKINEDGAATPLRLNDLFAFLNDRERYTSCPHCDHEGVWEVSMYEEGDEQTENPRLQLFKINTSEGGHHTFSGMTCPKCGHFAQISTYKIRQFLDGEERPKWVK